MVYKKRKAEGFTLLELVIVIVVIGILSTLALPNYTRSREQALGREAQSNLRLVLAAEKIYRMEYPTYWPASGSDSNLININNNLKLSLTDTNWTWAITGTSGPPPTFTASADRRGSGGYLNCQYTINQNSTDPAPIASCP